MCAQSSCTASRIEQAFHLRDSITRAYAWQDHLKLQALARSCIRFTPCAATLAVTGVGRLLGDKVLWAGVNESTRSLVLVTKARW